MAVNRKEYARHSKRVTSTQRWQVLRHKILERDNWKCQCCGDRRRLEVDHIVPVRFAPERAFDPSNLQALCGPCHAKKTRIECGHKPLDPKRQSWREAVAELAAETATPAKE
jgi:5-methylcytosine-specific restriction protein A